MSAPPPVPPAPAPVTTPPVPPAPSTAAVTNAVKVVPQFFTGGNAQSGFAWTVKLPLKEMRRAIFTDPEVETFVATYPNLVWLGEDMLCTSLAGKYSDGSCLLAVREATAEDICEKDAQGDQIQIELSKDNGKTYTKETLFMCKPKGTKNGQEMPMMLKNLDNRAGELKKADSGLCTIM